MASGIVGKASLDALVLTQVYEVPASILAVVNISVCNRSTDSVLVRLALVNVFTDSVDDADYIEYDVTIPGNGVLERTGLVMHAAASVVAFASLANVSVSVWGYEEAE